jgi:hypothetical protein
VHRDSRFLLAIDSSWASSDSDRTGQANIDWVEGFADGMRSYTTEYAYRNFIDRSQADLAHAYYGDNLNRLIDIKSRHDPDDFFRFAQSVPLQPFRYVFRGYLWGKALRARRYRLDPGSDMRRCARHGSD